MGVIVILLGLVGFAVYCLSEGRTRQTRDRRFKSGFRDTGIEVDPQSLIKSDKQVATGMLLMTPAILFILGFVDQWILALIVLSIMWGSLARTYFSDLKKLDIENRRNEEIDSATSFLISKLESITDKKFLNSPIRRYQEIPKLSHASSASFASQISRIGLPFEKTTVTYGETQWGDRYTVSVNSDALPNETVLYFRFQEDRIPSKDIETQRNKDIIFTAEFIAIALSLRWMPENKQEYIAINNTISCTTRTIDPRFLQYLIIPYSNLSIDIKETSTEKEDRLVPQGAIRIGRRYKYERNDGGPDRRYSDNPFIVNCRAWELVIRPQQTMETISIKFWHKKEAESLKQVLDKFI